MNILLFDDNFRRLHNFVRSRQHATGEMPVMRFSLTESFLFQECTRAHFFDALFKNNFARFDVPFMRR
jgi:hypothetical protein